MATLVVLIVASSSTLAGDGFPPLGAWAYGYGPNTAISHRTVGRVVPTFTFHRGYYGARHVWPHRSFVHAAWYPRVRYYAPVYSYSTFFYPTVAWPPYYYAPTYSYPAVSAGWGYPLCQTSAIDSGQILSVGKSPLASTSTVLANRSIVSQPSSVTLAASASDTLQSARLVAWEKSDDPVVAVEQRIPEDLLAAADEILLAGGYREAGTAYARLNVQFGSTSQIYGRRFIAQIASGDFDQAALIMATAAAAGYKITPYDLPGGNLYSLFGDTGIFDAAAEQLAAIALANPSEAEPLQLVSLWLELAGESERADLFRTLAQRLKHGEPVASKSNLVSLQ